MHACMHTHTHAHTHAAASEQDTLTGPRVIRLDGVSMYTDRHILLIEGSLFSEIRNGNAAQYTHIYKKRQT